MRIEQAVDRQLRKRGIPTRFRRDFLGNSAKWGRQQLQDWFGSDAARAHGAGLQLMSVLPASVSQMPDFNAFQNELAGYNEVVRWPLYSYKAYAAAGQAQLTFFDQNEGTATLGRADTNMQLPSALPGSNMHVAASARIHVIPARADVAATSVASALAFGDWWAVLNVGCWAEITVSEKNYLIAAPLTILPAGQGVGSWHQTSGINTANSVSLANNGVASNEAIYHLDPPLGILPTRTFGATMNWRALVTVATAGRIGITLDGWRLRSVQ